MTSSGTDPVWLGVNRVLGPLALSAEAIKEEFYDQTGIMRWSQTTGL